jgi:hypothetical protein
LLYNKKYKVNLRNGDVSIIKWVAILIFENIIFQLLKY